MNVALIRSSLAVSVYAIAGISGWKIGSFLNATPDFGWVLILASLVTGAIEAMARRSIDSDGGLMDAATTDRETIEMRKFIQRRRAFLDRRWRGCLLAYMFLIASGVALKFVTLSTRATAIVAQLAVTVFFLTIPAMLTFLAAYRDITSTKLIIEEKQRLARSLAKWNGPPQPQIPVR